MIRIDDYRFAFERQPLSRPFHFKGGFFTQKWINVIRVADVVGIGGNAVLWSDPAVFHAYSEDGGNILMTALAERAVQIVSGGAYRDPIEVFHAVRDELHSYGCLITGRVDLTPTFTLNAMVALDLAVWKAYAAERKTERWIELVPQEFRTVFDRRVGALARAPLVTYNVPVAEAVDLARRGHKVLKIKLGQAGSPAEMLRKDSLRLGELHRSLDEESVFYYLDANGRYETLDDLMRLLDHADDLGMMSRILVLEEPFAYEKRIDVSGIPIRVAADESLHGVDDLQERLDLGYGALALKPAGKTLSLSLLMAAAAAERGVPCFVADSACVPLLVEWNRVLASHLAPFPGLDLGLIESNGAQNYSNWATLMEEHPVSDAGWIAPREGLFVLDETFYGCSGGVFRSAGHYEDLVEAPA